jgi:hypothetical protein
MPTLALLHATSKWYIIYRIYNKSHIYVYMSSLPTNRIHPHFLCVLELHQWIVWDFYPLNSTKNHHNMDKNCVENLRKTLIVNIQERTLVLIRDWWCASLSNTQTLPAVLLTSRAGDMGHHQYLPLHRILDQYICHVAKYWIFYYLSRTDNTWSFHAKIE